MSRPTVDELVDAFTLEPMGGGSFRARNIDTPHGAVFGGQLLGQALLAAVAGRDPMEMKTLHTVFARAARPGAPLDIDVEEVHAGRTFATLALTIRQGERLCVRSQALLSADEPDLIRHAAPAPSVAPPDSSGGAPSSDGDESWQISVVDDVDLVDPEAVGPPTLDVWVRFVGAEGDTPLHQALLAFASDGFLIGTAMRPHAGVGQAQAHRTLSTGVVSHTITFHEPLDAGEWTLLSHRSTYAGRGRCFGTGDGYRSDGQLAATYVQDGMIRPRDPAAGTL